MRRLASRVVHPFLFAAFPVLALYTHNLDITPVRDVFAPLLVALAMALAVWGLARLVCKDTRKAAFAATLFLLLFFSYGHVFGQDRRMLAVWCGIFLAGGCALTRLRYNPERLTVGVNVASIALTIGVLLNITICVMLNPSKPLSEQAVQAARNSAPTTSDPTLPDIYYIILDMYGGPAALKETLHFDDSPFIDRLRQRGFFVAAKSRSNYVWTAQSLASSLNLDYLNAPDGTIQVKSKDLQALFDLIENNAAADFLRSKGYGIVRLDHGFRISGRRGGVYIFSIALMKTTMLAPVAELLLNPFIRKSVRGMFHKLSLMPKSRGPRFIFAHIICPHPPYIFGPNGEDKPLLQILLDTKLHKEQCYVDQVMYVNKEVERLVDTLLKDSKTPPIIILQGDHGPDLYSNWTSPSDAFLRERTGILNAYYLPGEAKSLLYDSITPVNTFRLIFNAYFHTHYPLVSDERTYFTGAERPFDFRDVTEKVK